MDAKGALKLLEDAGLIAELRKLFGQAADLGVNANVIATIVLADLLIGPLSNYLSEEALRAVERLLAQAHHESALIEELGQQGIDLLQMAQAGANRNIFNHKVREGLERFAGFRGLLDHAKLWVKHVVSKGGSSDQHP